MSKQADSPETQVDSKAALEQLRPELPALVGDDWPELEAKLEALVEQLESDTIEASLFEARLPELFKGHKEARARFRKLLKGDGAVQRDRSIAGRLMGTLRAMRHPEVTRYTDIACPNVVSRDAQRVSIVVRLCVKPPRSSAAVKELGVLEGMTVAVRVVAPGFEILNNATQKTLIEKEKDSAPVVFDLRPEREGSALITIDFFQDGNPVGTASFPIEVTSAPTSHDEQSHIGPALQLAFDARPPQLALFITHDPYGAQPSLSFRLYERDHSERSFPPVPLFSDPRNAARRYYERLVSLTRRKDPTHQNVKKRGLHLASSEVATQIKQMGQSMWKELFPPGFKKLYGERRARWEGNVMLIVSDEPHFPWELVWPYSSEEGWEDAEPWCASLRLTRWLRRDPQGQALLGATQALRLRSLACIAPTDSGLPAAASEREMIAEWAKRHDVRDLSPNMPGPRDVRELLEGGELDWMHIASHGSFDEQIPNADTAAWLQEKYPLTPDIVVGPAIEKHLQENRTAFIFNACHLGRQGWELSGLGGWASRLLSAGAGLFIAPLWTVIDGSARSFAQTLYKELANNTPVAEAVLLARNAIRRAGDPTWLAYSVYAHPNACLDIQSATDKGSARMGEGETSDEGASSQRTA